MALYFTAARQGRLLAQDFLANLYQKGLGVPKSYVHAYFWFALSGIDGNPVTPRRLDALEKLMSPEDISRAQALAEECRDKNKVCD
jgi:TPR repeat protein